MSSAFFDSVSDAEDAPPPAAYAADDDDVAGIEAGIKDADDEASYLQAQNNLPEALVVLERALVLRTRAYGVQSEQVVSACKMLAELCNLQAIGDLARGDFKAAIELLKKAQILTEKHPLVRAVTFNNYACYYRRCVRERVCNLFCARFTHGAGSYGCVRFLLVF